MKTRTLLAIALLILSCLLFIGSTYQTTPAWEYRIEKDADEKRLNQVGAEGWELVTLDRGTGSLSRSMFVFKRRRQ